MVYCGKPSRACQTCKSRHIKCDEVRPSCTQCTRTNRECPGYKNEFDLIHRNETSAVKRRVERKKAGTPPQTGSRTSPSSSASPALSSSGGLSITFSAIPTPPRTDSGISSVDSASEDGSEVVSNLSVSTVSISPSPPDFSPDRQVRGERWQIIPAALTIPVHDMATSFFFRNFIVDTYPRSDGKRGYLEHVIPIYVGAMSDSAVHVATHAVALAAMAKYPGNGALRQSARESYSKAIKMVSKAIQDPVLARSDETLTATLLFSLFEAISQTSLDMNSWGSHVDGAVAIVKLRGKEMIKGKASLQLFRAVRAMMLTGAIQRTKPLDDFPDPRGWYCDDGCEQNPANRLTRIALRLPGIRVEAQELLRSPKTPAIVARILDMVDAVQQLDADLDEWSRTLPDTFYYKTIDLAPPIPLDVDPVMVPRWMGPVHVYDDLHTANCWNDYRVTRIFCQTVILWCAAALDSPNYPVNLTEALAHANYMIQEMVDGVCSSVPFHLDPTYQPPVQKFGQDELAAEATGSYFIILPMFVISKLPQLPEQQKRWILGALYRVGRGLGLDEAQTVFVAERHIFTQSGAPMTESAT